MILECLQHIGPPMRLATNSTRPLTLMCNAIILIRKARNEYFKPINAFIKLIEQVAGEIDQIQIDTCRNNRMLLAIFPLQTKTSRIQHGIP